MRATMSTSHGTSAGAGGGGAGGAGCAGGRGAAARRTAGGSHRHIEEVRVFVILLYILKVIYINNK